MRNAKKYLAALTAAMMVLSPMTAFAASPGSGEIDSKGDYEGYVDKNVFSVTAPTVTSIEFTIDPQGLLATADDSTYAGTAEEPAVWFKNTGGTFSDTSDAIKIINESSYDIDVSLNITLTSTGIDLVDDTDLATATGPALSLKVMEGVGKSPDSTKDDYITKATYATTAAKLPGIDTQYEIKAFTDDDKDQATGTLTEEKSPSGYYYAYQLKSDYKAEDSESVVTYTITGDCNDVDGWSAINTASAVTAKIVWSCTKHSNLSVTGTAYSISKTDNEFTVAWDSSVQSGDKVIASVLGSMDGTNYTLTFAEDSYSLSDTKLTIDGTKGPIGQGAVGQKRYIKVTAKDGSTAIITVDVSR